MMKTNKIYHGDSLAVLSGMPDGFAQCCVTSPPYWGLRDYGVDGQAGLESTPEAYIENMVDIFAQVRRVLKDDGTLWVNIGDSYVAPKTGSPGNKSTITGGQRNQNEAGKRPDKKHAGALKPKDMIGIPWMLAFALRADGWYLRQDIIWHKTNGLPESVKDRCTSSHEHIFLLSKRPKYYFDADAIAEPAKWERWGNQTENKIHQGKAGYLAGADLPVRDTKNKRDVWSIPTKGFVGAHFATYPPDLIRPCIMAGSKQGDIILDPFMGSGTTAIVAQQEQRKWVGIELNESYIRLAEKRIQETCGMF